MNRREFLKGSVTAWVASSIPTVVIFHGTAHASQAQQGVENLRTHMIWSSESVPVPSRQSDRAASISSSSSGQPAIPNLDLHSVFFKEFFCDDVPTIASMRIFAYTRYRLYINGVYQGRGPSRFQNQRPEYDTRDITSALRKGRNTIVVLVHRDAPTGRIMHHEPGLAAVVQLGPPDDRRLIATDATWLAIPELSFGPRDQAWSSIEENIDARKSTNWTTSEFSPVGWPAAIPVSGPDFFPVWPRTTPLQRESARSWHRGAESYPIELDAGSEISFELPEIVQGYHVLDFDADEGSALQVTYALPDQQESGRCTYIARSGPQRWMGDDTFAHVGLKIRITAGHIRIHAAKAVEVRYPFDRVGAFRCSDQFLNQLWSICARSLEVLSEDSYVDCADRERVEWTDDSPPAFDCTRVIMRGPDEGGQTHWGDGRLLAGLLRRIALTQQPDGQLKAHSCSERFDIHAIMEDRSCDWVVLLREYLESSGDAALVQELWPTLVRLLAWYRMRTTRRGLVLAREWEVWDNPLRYQICEGAGLNAMVHRALLDAAFLAEKIGKQSEASSLQQEAANLNHAFNAELWNDESGAYDGALFGPGSEIRPQLGHPFTGSVVDGRYPPTAQANLFALYGRIVPTERIDRVRNWILRHHAEVREPMSHYYLFQMLYAMNDTRMDEQVLDLIRSGWKNQVASAWQTTWEELENGGGSKIHMYGMHPGFFLSAFVLGARREGPKDQREIIIDPRFSGLDWAKGTCVTEFGPVAMEWKKVGSRQYQINCTIPERVNARFLVPSAYAEGKLNLDGNLIPSQRESGSLIVVLSPGSHEIRLAGS